MMRRVRIIVFVGILMMFSVTRHPFDERHLRSKHSSYRKTVLHHNRRLKRPVRKKPMKADRDTKTRNEEERNEKHERKHVDSVIPEMHDTDDESKQRRPHKNVSYQFLQTSDVLFNSMFLHNRLLSSCVFSVNEPRSDIQYSTEGPVFSLL